MKISISSKLYQNYRLEETVKRVAKLGYDGIEIWGGRPHAYYRDINRTTVSSIRESIEKAGLEISGFIPAQFGYPTSLCSPISTIRKDSVEYIKKSIDTSLLLGCRKVSLCPGRTLFGQGYDSGMAELISSLDELVDYSVSKEVLLLLEPAHMMESDLVLTVNDGVRLIEEQKYPNMGIALDTGHCHVNKESLIDCLLLLKGKNIPLHVHLDDNNGLTDQHKIPGEGTICFTPFFQTLLETGYKGFLTVELGFDHTSSPDEAAYQSRKFVLSVLEDTNVRMKPTC
jgi:protein FrlC